MNEPDGGIYITAQLLADAEFWYGPIVFYSYSVAGQKYENVTLSFKQDSHTQSKEYAESIVAKYPPGGAVTVSYRPNNPSNSTIETGLGDGWPWLLLILFFFITLGFGAYLAITG